MRDPLATTSIRSAPAARMRWVFEASSDLSDSGDEGFDAQEGRARH